MEEWGNFPLERKRLFDLIAKTKVKGVVLLSGNVHFFELSATKFGTHRLYDFTSSGITHNTPAYATLRNKYRVGGPYTKFNFGLVEVDWKARPNQLIALKAIDADGLVVFQQSLSLDP